MIKYLDIVDYNKIDFVYKKICSSTRHKEKLVRFELFKFTNCFYIYNTLLENKYIHGKYNVFLIKYPKYRIIMSENLIDKIVNHLVSYYFLFPVIEPKLIDFNIATRTGRGLDKGIDYIKKYLNKMKNDYHNYYVLKCDITKFFYNIDHEILFSKLQKIIKDEDILSLIKNIVNSTNLDYVNIEIEKILNNEISKVKNKNIINKLKNIPCYKKGKGLPIGNMTSQILAIFYLNNVDHFIKEKLGIKYYVRYQDDLIMFHQDKEYLKKVKNCIGIELAKLKLELNNKTVISRLDNGFNFLGYRFLFKEKRIIILPVNSMKKRIRKRYKKEGKIILERYNGYLNRCLGFNRIYSLEYRNDIKRI